MEKRSHKKKPDILTGSTQPVANVPQVEAIREPIKQMTGFKSAEEMADSLPSDTMTAAPEDAPRRKRRTKAEMEALRGGDAPAQVDPLLNDPRYRKAIAGMQGFGGPRIIKGGFSAVAVATSDPKIKLNDEEGATLDDFFYVLGKRYTALDPSSHWFTMTLYFFGMLGTFIFDRVLQSKGNSLQKQIAKMFGGEPEDHNQPQEGE